MSEENKSSDIIVNKFTEESAKDFRSKVLKRSQIDPSLPITVYIDSYGGYIDSLNSMLETMEQVPNPIVTVCIGKAMSAGAVLLAAGDHRFCGRRSRVMVHQGSSGAGGPIESLQNDVNESKRLNNQMIKLLAERCKMSVRKFKEEMKKRLTKDDDEARDMYLDAKSALEIGIVDNIGMPIIKPLVMYAIDTAPEHDYDKSMPASLEEALSDAGITETKSIKKTKKKVKKKSTRRKTGGSK